MKGWELDEELQGASSSVQRWVAVSCCWIRELRARRLWCTTRRDPEGDENVGGSWYTLSNGSTPSIAAEGVCGQATSLKTLDETVCTPSFSLRSRTATEMLLTGHSPGSTPTAPRATQGALAVANWALAHRRTCSGGGWRLQDRQADPLPGKARA